MDRTVWTIGHSTQSFEEFLAVLAAHRIGAVADVRRFPGSRRNPQYSAEALRLALPKHDIEYHWLPELGGRRRAAPDSPNTAWRNEAFRGYADHMASAEFASGLDKLLELSGRLRTTIMCAEVLWWRCHRALISDELTARGMRVMHISDAQHVTAHSLTSPARIVDGRLSYASEQSKLF
jgi:uncharacterized protein (DUF488 family)